MISERLMEEPSIDAGDVSINVTGGRVTLEATVYSRRMKYEIEEVVEEFGGEDVRNNIRVERTQAPQGSSSSQGAAIHRPPSPPRSPTRPRTVRGPRKSERFRPIQFGERAKCSPAFSPNTASPRSPHSLRAGDMCAIVNSYYRSGSLALCADVDDDNCEE